MSEFDVSRRDFFGAAWRPEQGCSWPGAAASKTVEPMKFNDAAPDGPVLKAGLVGCGGRGTGAVQNFLKAGPNLQIVALGDVFQDQLDKCRSRLEGRPRHKITDETCFVGFDAYKKVIDSGVDIVILATPPHFRPASLRSGGRGQEARLHGKARGGRSRWARARSWLPARRPRPTT